jgi:hypothetical protein
MGRQGKNQGRVKAVTQPSSIGYARMCLQSVDTRSQSSLQRQPSIHPSVSISECHLLRLPTALRDLRACQ